MVNRPKQIDDVAEIVADALDTAGMLVPKLPSPAGSDSMSTWWFAFDHKGETVQIDLLPGGKIRLWDMPTFQEDISIDQARTLALTLWAAVKKAEQG